MRDYAAISDQFVKEVLNGTILDDLFRAAVVRNENDLIKAGLSCADKPYPYRFDPQIADKACALAEQFAMPKGDNRGERFELQPWQVWLFRTLFGWVHRKNRKRSRWRRVYCWIPKGNGKSPIAALIGLIVIAIGRQTGAQVFNAATSQQQARDNVFVPAQEMLSLSPEVKRDAQLEVTKHEIVGVGDARVFKPISAEKRSADGSVGDCYIVDEIHMHPDRSLWDVLVNNSSKVAGSRIVMISTAGTDRNPTAIGWQVYCETKDILTGKLENDSIFALISEANRKRDPWAEETWKRANPNYGVSVDPDGFKDVMLSARAQPSSQPHTLATRLGWWPESAVSAFLTEDRWSKAADPKLSLDQFEGDPAWIGLDLASQRDMAAKVLVFRRTVEGKPHFYAFASTYLNEDAIYQSSNASYSGWVTDGHLISTPGSATDYDRIEQDVMQDAKRFSVQAVAFDEAQAVHMAQHFDADGMETVKIRQGFGLSYGMKQIDVALAEGRFHHAGDPCFSWQVLNANAETGTMGDIKPVKAHDAAKIDAFVALCMAMSRAAAADEAPEAGLWFIERGVA